MVYVFNKMYNISPHSKWNFYTGFGISPLFFTLLYLNKMFIYRIFGNYMIKILPFGYATVKRSYKELLYIFSGTVIMMRKEVAIYWQSMGI